MLKRWRKKAGVPTKNNILVKATKTVQTISPIYGINLFMCRLCVGNILSDRKKKAENETRETEKWLEGEKLARS